MSDIREAFEAWFDKEFDPEITLTMEDKEMCFEAWQAALQSQTAPAVPERIIDIGRKMISDAKNNDHYTADPVFVVQKKRLVTGIDTDYASEIGWFDCDCGLIQGEEADALEREFDLNGEEPDGYSRTGYAWEWEYVDSYLTREAAEARINGGPDGRVMVESAFRNSELRAVRNFIMSLAAPQPDHSPDAGKVVPQVMGRVAHLDDGSVVCHLNSVGRALPDHTALYDHPAPAADGGEVEPVAYLTWHQAMHAIDDYEEVLAIASPSDKSADGTPAFPVYTHPAESRDEIQAQALEKAFQQLAAEYRPHGLNRTYTAFDVANHIEAQGRYYAARLRASQQEGGDES